MTTTCGSRRPAPTPEYSSWSGLRSWADWGLFAFKSSFAFPLRLSLSFFLDSGAFSAPNLRRPLELPLPAPRPQGSRPREGRGSFTKPPTTARHFPFIPSISSSVTAVYLRCSSCQAPLAPTDDLRHPIGHFVVGSSGVEGPRRKDHSRSSTGRALGAPATAATALPTADSRQYPVQCCRMGRGACILPNCPTR